MTSSHIHLRAPRLMKVVIIGLISVVMVLPMVWMVLSAFRSDAEILAQPFGMPSVWRWEQWREAWAVGNLGQYGLNSLVVTTLTVVGVLTLGSAAAFALARGVARAKFQLGLYLLGLVVPAQAAVVPIFVVLRVFGLLDTWWALVLPYVAWNLPLAVFVFHGFFSSQSREPEEAAQLDGCGVWRLFWSVALPLARPAAGVVAVITTLGTWNEFLFALLFVSSDSAKTLPVGLLAFSSAHTTDHGLTFAALAIMTLPLLLAYAFVQRSVIEGSAGLSV